MGQRISAVAAVERNPRKKMLIGLRPGTVMAVQWVNVGTASWKRKKVSAVLSVTER